MTGQLGWACMRPRRRRVSLSDLQRKKGWVRTSPRPGRFELQSLFGRVFILHRATSGSGRILSVRRINGCDLPLLVDNTPQIRRLGAVRAVGSEVQPGTCFKLLHVSISLYELASAARARGAWTSVSVALEPPGWFDLSGKSPRSQSQVRNRSDEITTDNNEVSPKLKALLRYY